MDAQKIVNLLNKSEVESQKFATRKWCIISSTRDPDYGGANNANPNPIKFETKTLKSNLCDYSDAYILVTGKISVAQAADCVVAFKNCVPFISCTVKINDEHIEEVKDFETIMPLYNLIEYSDNYQDCSASLYQYKRDDPPSIDGGNAASNIEANNSNSFKYKAELLANIVQNGNTVQDGADARKIDIAKIVVPIKYLSNFFRALEMLLIN